MKKSIIYSILLLSLVFSSCEEYLDMKVNSSLTGEQVFNDANLFQKYLDDIYTYYHYWPGDWACQSFGGLGRIAYSSFEGATDLAEASRAVAGTNASFNLGNWSPSAYGAQVELIWPWTGSYAAIRRCNVVLEKVDNVPGLTQVQKDKDKAEALFSRAFFHFELIKRYGGVPYLTKSLSEKDSMDFKRETYDTCVAKIVHDIETALPNLPLTRPDGEFGRPTIGAALALKAKVLLYAASPLNTESYDINIGSRDPNYYFVEQPNTAAEIHQKWVDAAQAAYAVIKLAADNNYLYALVDSSRYMNVFYGDPTNSEIIFSRVDGKFSFDGGKALMGWVAFRDVSASKGYGGSAGTYPTQNLIDMYDMEDGSKPILGYEADGKTPIINPTSGYSDDKMFENRDLRLKLTVLSNQDMWQDRRVELWYNRNDPKDIARDVMDAQDYTTTGYLTRKTWPEELRQGRAASVSMNWTWFRYADVLLWYAEAMNQAFGPDVDGIGAGNEKNPKGTGDLMTARWALNKVRNRMNPQTPHKRDVVASSKDEFQERLMNERAVEFVYEEQRWWDVIRWKKGVDVFNKPVYGVKTYKTSNPGAPLSFEIERRKIEDRVFFDYMHKYPIPYAEIEKSPSLKQNPGW
ncbi:MAG TPA: RagB/SusD family nutrient uptake outer membrane protein [Paludibacter sp.]|nr:RagB/SusD family nutrient uptake outer membrane protein [Paludibacter sp.]